MVDEKTIRKQLAALIPDDFGAASAEANDDETTPSGEANVLDVLTPQLRKPGEIYIMQDPLRPSNFDEIVGQDHIKATLIKYIDSAVRRNRLLDHVLFTGGPGLGKTTFASVIAGRQGSNLIIDTGPALTQQKILDHMAKIITQNKLAKENPNEIAKVTLFIDEFHATPREAQTILLPILEDFNFLGMHVPEFTCVAATTDIAKIPEPLRARFGIDYDLHYYTDEEIYQILIRSYGILWDIEQKQVEARLADTPYEWPFGFPQASDARKGLESIARRSIGIPRNANKLLKRVFDFALTELPHDREMGEALLTPEIVSEAMEAVGVDSFGLDRTERRIVSTMFKRFGTTPRSPSAIASAVGIKEANFSEVYEKNLIRLGFMNRETRGRVLTDKGIMLAGLIDISQVPY